MESYSNLRCSFLIIGLVGALVLAVGIYLYMNRNKYNKGLKEPMSTEPVYVLFYLDTCGHCRTILQIWDKMTGKFPDRPRMVKYEARENYSWVKDYNVNGVPDIRFYPNGMSASGTFVRYEGSRTEESLTAFIKKPVTQSKQ